MKFKHWLILCFSFFILVNLFSQSPLLAQTQSKFTVQKHLRELDSLIQNKRGVDAPAFVAHSLSYIALAKKENAIDSAAKKAINIESTLSRTLKKPTKAVQILSSVLAEKYQIKDSFLLAHLYYKRARAYYYYDLKKAVEDFEKALELYPSDRLNVIGDAYLFKANTQADLGNYIAASQDYEMAYKTFEKIKDTEYMMYARQGNINMYSMNGFYEKAIEERKSFIKTLTDLSYNKSLSTLYYNQALDFKKSNRDSLVLPTLMKAKQNVSSNNLSLITGIEGELLKYYVKELGTDNNKTKNQLKTVKALDNGGILEDAAAELLYHSALATYYYFSKDYNKALQHALQRNNIAIKKGHQEEIKDSHNLLANIYEAQGKFSEALYHKNEYNEIKDDIFSQNNAFTLAYYQTLYETERKEKALIEKNKNISLLENENKSYKRQSIFTGILILLSFGFILLYRSQTHLKQKKLQQERFSQELIVNQEQERIRISKDLHDGLGQQLLLIKNKLVSNNDVKAKKMVNDAIEEVRTISRDLYPFQLQELGLTKAIKHALVVIDENTTLFISSEIDTIDNLFTPEQEVNVYRIVQEALNNVIKHAKAEASKVSVKKLSNLLVISIRDNGKGFDFNEKYQDVKSLGLKTLLERTKFLNGQMKVQSIKDKGTLLEFQIPLNK